MDFMWTQNRAVRFVRHFSGDVDFCHLRTSVIKIHSKALFNF